MKFKSPSERAEDAAIYAGELLDAEEFHAVFPAVQVSFAFAIASIAHSLEIIAEHHARQAGTGGNS